MQVIVMNSQKGGRAKTMLAKHGHIAETFVGDRTAYKSQSTKGQTITADCLSKAEICCSVLNRRSCPMALV